MNVFLIINSNVKKYKDRFNKFINVYYCNLVGVFGVVYVFVIYKVYIFWNKFYFSVNNIII